MFQLLLLLILTQMAIILSFVFRTPFRKLFIMGLDRAKRGRGPIVAKTVAATVFAVMLTTAYNAAAVRRRWLQDGEINPTDQILFARNLLQASLMGFSLFLALMMDRLHYYIRELRIRRKTMEATKKHNRVSEDQKSPNATRALLERELAAQRETIQQLEAQIEEKGDIATSAEASAEALKKQSEGFLDEYGRLLEENQKLRSQLQYLPTR